MNATIAQLRHFIALAESGSFRRGADKTNRSQAAFSRSIAMLEAGLGVTLVARQTQRFTLTQVGRAVLEHARQVVAQTDELMKTVHHHANDEVGTLRIGLGATPAAVLATPLLRHAAQHPSGLRLTLSSGPLQMQVNALRERKLDALIIDAAFIQPMGPDLVVDEIVALPTGLLCRPQHPLLNQNNLTLGELLKFPLAGTEIAETTAKKMTKQYGPEAYPATMFSYISEDIRSLLDLVGSTDVIYAGVLAGADAALRQGRLVRLPFPSEGLESRVAWVQRATSASDTVLAGLRQLVQAELQPFKATDT